MKTNNCCPLDKLREKAGVSVTILNIFLLIFLFSCLKAQSDIINLKLLEGNASYTATTKMVGLLKKKVKAINKKLSAKVSLTEDCKLTGKLKIEVNGFNSGSDIRDEHVFEILKGKQYPVIIFEIVGVPEDEIERVSEETGVEKVEVQGMSVKDCGKVNVKEIAKKMMSKAEAGVVTVRANLMVAGKTNEYDFHIKFKREGENVLFVQTERFIKFTDFNISPPTFGVFLSRSLDEIFVSGYARFLVEW